MKTLMIAAVIGLASSGAIAQTTTTTTAPSTTNPSTAAPAAGTTAPATGTMAPAASTTAPAASAPAMPMSQLTPQEFVNMAASGGMFEVESSKLALQRSQSDDVKAFAQMMIDDHTKANDELKTIAGNKNLNVPAEPMGGPADHMQAVMNAEGSNFDSTYIQHQQQAHAETIQLFETEASSSDPELAAFANKTLPTLRMHAEHASMLKM